MTPLSPTAERANGRRRPPHVAAPRVIDARTYVYLRISKADATESHPDGIKAGLEAQRSRCTNYVAERALPGWAPKHEYVDDGVSAGINFGDRPAGKLLLAEVREGDHLVIAKVDRGFRDILDCIATLRQLAAKRVAVHVLDLPLPPELPDAIREMIFSIMSCVAQFERARIRERTKEAMRERKARGYVVGGHPGYGYKTVVVNGLTRRGAPRRKVVEDETEMAVMALIHKRRTALPRPMSWAQIADEMNRAKIKVRKGEPWHKRKLMRWYQEYLRILARREKAAGGEKKTAQDCAGGAISEQVDT